MKRELQPSGYVTYSTPIHDDMVMAVAMAVWWAWKEHERYLEVTGPVAIVSGAGVLETMPVHPLFGPSHPLRGPSHPLGGPLWASRGGRFR